MQAKSLAVAALATISLAACQTRQRTESDNMRTLPVEQITVEGILIDTWCYARDEANGRTPWPPRVDTTCSSKSMAAGYPVAVVVDSDSVWVLSESPRIFAKFLNDSVRVSGDIRSAGVLIPRKFDRKIDNAWQNIF